MCINFVTVEHNAFIVSKLRIRLSAGVSLYQTNMHLLFSFMQRHFLSEFLNIASKTKAFFVAGIFDFFPHRYFFRIHFNQNTWNAIATAEWMYDFWSYLFVEPLDILSGNEPIPHVVHKPNKINCIDRTEKPFRLITKRSKGQIRSTDHRHYGFLAFHLHLTYDRSIHYFNIACFISRNSVYHWSDM